MKSIPFAVQLSLIVFFILIIPFIALMTYTGYATLQYSEEEIARTSLESIEVNRRFTENFMNNISASILRFVADHEFVGYVGLQKYSAIQGNVDNGMKIQRLQKELLSIERSDPAIMSIFLFFDDGDYVISTDRGIVELTDYYSLAWLRTVSEQRRGLAGVWVPREFRTATVRDILRGQDSERFIPVISYVYSLNRLTTAIGGTMVINIWESSVAENLNPGRARDSPYGNILLQRDGKIISHPQDSSFLLQGRNLPHIADILDNDQVKGYTFYREGNHQVLYTWLKTGYYEWVYFSIQSMETLLSRSAWMIRNVILLSISVVFAGTLVSLGVFARVSRPMRELVKGFRESAGFEAPKLRNEMDILSSAFSQIEHKERELRELLNEREKDAVLLAIRNLLSEDLLDRQEEEILAPVFPHRLFQVAAAALDNYEEYRRRTNTEQRAYHHYLFISQAEEAFGPPLKLRGLRLHEARIALIINLPEEGAAVPHERISALLKELQEKAPPIFGTTITIGLSETGFDLGGARTCARQASEAVLMRMLRGGNSIIPWEGYKQGRKRFFYPQNSEGRILNYLDMGNLESITAELEGIMKTIRGGEGETRGISYDNICFIYNQLAGVTIKRLSEMNINTAGFFFEHGNLYNAIASSETLDQLSRYMTDFYQDILNRLHRDQDGEEKPIDRILACFERHYREDMFFEDMAAELGISYSYMRKIVRDSTGKSVLDTINIFRIQEAKNLLLDEKLTLPQIAKAVGYRNIQSLNRYFKKFEGLTPQEYRLAHRVSRHGA